MEDLLRYQRQLQLPEWSLEAQQQLAQTRVLLVGLGGLGCPVALYLTAAGVGQLTLVDADRVSLSNLHRQVLYTPDDVGALKVEAAAARLRALNPQLQCETLPEHLTPENVLALFGAADVIVDCTDNLLTRYLINDVCQHLQKTWIYGSVYRFEGQVSTFTGEPRSGCYRCLYPEMPAASAIPSCSEAGVFGTLPGTVAQIQATEVLRQMGQWSEGLSRHVLLLDLKAMSFHRLKKPYDKNCLACGTQACLDLSRYTLQDPLAGVPLWDAVAIPEHYQVLDVREKLERLGGYLDGLHVPLAELRTLSSEKLLQVLNPEVPLLVYCQKGLRSAQAVTYLQHHGFRQVFSLRGGYENWSSSQRSSLVS